MELAGGGCLQFIIALFIGIFGVGILAGGEAPPPLQQSMMQVTLEGEPAAAEALERAALVIQQRLDTLELEGVAELNPDFSIRVTFPVLETPNPDEVVTLLTATGTLELVDFSGLEPMTLVNQPIITTTRPNYAAGARLNPLTDQPFESVLTGADVLTAVAEPSQFDSSVWIVRVTFTPEAGERLRIFSREHIGEPLGIVVDGVAVSVPVIQSEVGSVVDIQSNFTRLDARRLAVSLSGDVLPVTLVVASMEMVETGS